MFLRQQTQQANLICWSQSTVPDYSCNKAGSLAPSLLPIRLEAVQRENEFPDESMTKKLTRDVSDPNL